MAPALARSTKLAAIGGAYALLLAAPFLFTDAPVLDALRNIGTWLPLYGGFLVALLLPAWLVLKPAPLRFAGAGLGASLALLFFYASFAWIPPTLAVAVVPVLGLFETRDDRNRATRRQRARR